MKVRGFLKDLTLKVEICGRFKTLEYLCLSPYSQQSFLEIISIMKIDLITEEYELY